MAIVDRPNMGFAVEDARRYRQDRERAYAEGFAEFLETAKDVEIGGQSWKLHPNINLYIDIGRACNADCAFCIAKTTYERGDLPINRFVPAARQAFAAVAHVRPSIQVVGGEPTISQSLPYILGLIRPFGFRLPVLGTNGMRLSRECVHDLKQAGVCHVNLSRHHYRDDVNAKIMGTPSLPSSADLAERLSWLGGDIGVRLQCNLISGYVDTYGEMMQFIAYGYHRLGVRSFSFSQLTPLPAGNIYQQGIIDYVNQRQVNIEEILAQVERDTRFRFVKFRGGVACYYEVWEYNAYEKSVTVTVKFSDNKWLVEADRLSGYVPDLIVHTDGTLCGSWDRNCKVMVASTSFD